MDFITLDFETTYTKEYSLSKLTTEEYLNDPRFQVIGVGIKFNQHNSHWFPGEQVEAALAKVPWRRVALVCHNARFDATILAWKYGIKPAFILDTLSMARPFHSSNAGGSLAKLVKHYELGEKGTEVVQAMGKRLEDFTPDELAQYGEYCKNDCDLTFGLLGKLQPQLPMSELRLIDLTIRLYTEPVLHLDTETIQQEINLEAERKAGLMAMVDQPKGVFSSNDKFAEFLRTLGIEPPVKPSPKKKNPDGSPKMAWAFAKGDADFMALLDHDDPLVSAAVEVRLGVKSTQRETRSVRFMGVAERCRGHLPVPLGYYNAHTGRYGGEEKINLQNLQRTSKKDPTRGLLRKAIMAGDGELLVVEDLSQIEARLLVWQANQTDRVEAFAQKRDVYSEQASVIYGRKVDRKANPDDFTPGFIGKAVVLGCGYGLGFLKFGGMIYVGMLGEKGILFDGSFVNVLGVNPDEFQAWVEGKEDILAKVIEAKPAVLTMLQWYAHLACAQRIINTFRENATAIQAYWKTAQRALDAMFNGEGYEFGGPNDNLFRTEGTSIILPNGMPIRYEGLERDDEGQYSFLRRKEGRIQRVRTYGGSVVENLTQALARIVITDVMLKVSTNPRWRIALQVHDEIVVAVPLGEGMEAQQQIRTWMKTPPAWAEGLPLDSEGSIAERWGDAK